MVVGTKVLAMEIVSIHWFLEYVVFLFYFWFFKFYFIKFLLLKLDMF